MTPIEKALATWYPTDHPLHNEPLHPALGLAGEAGELLDLYKKERFKNGVSWWDCANCGSKKSEHYGWQNTNKLSSEYTPKILDELGDLWYYLRILAYQQNIELDILDGNIQDDISMCLVQLNYHCAYVLSGFVRDNIVPHYNLRVASKWFQMTLRLLDITLDQVTESNWQKLKDGDNHGWKSARKWSLL